MEPEHASVEPGVKVEVIEHTEDSGGTLLYERMEAEFAVGGFDQSPEYKAHCETCPRHGRNFACPPFSPTFAAFVGDARRVRVICLRLPLEYFEGIDDDERYRNGHHRAQALLTDELLRYRGQGYKVMGSGPCRFCAECAAEKGKGECLFPDKRIYSLESLGVNVVALVRESMGFDLDWSGTADASGYVSAVGAVVEQNE